VHAQLHQAAAVLRLVCMVCCCLLLPLLCLWYSLLGVCTRLSGGPGPPRGQEVLAVQLLRLQVQLLLIYSFCSRDMLATAYLS